MKLHHTQRIAAPPERVFAFLDDDDKLPLWMEGLEETVYPDGRDAADPVGARFRQRLSEGGRAVVYEGEIVAHERPHRLAVHLHVPGFAVTADYRLRPDGAGTRLDYRAEVRFGRVLPRLMAPLHRGAMRRIVARQMDSLRAAVEAAKEKG